MAREKEAEFKGRARFLPPPPRKMPIGDLNIARPLYSTAAASKETKGLGNRVFHDTTTTTKEKKRGNQ